MWLKVYINGWTHHISTWEFRYTTLITLINVTEIIITILQDLENPGFLC